MGYALKLNKVNFSSVAVDYVTFVEEVPCTGITLNKNSITVDKAEGTDQLVATLTPSDTTDQVIWSSSNENVATVVNGVVTVHGIGTATITATCGEQTATATVNQTTIKAQYDFKVATGVYASAVDASDGGGRIYAMSNDNTQSTGGQLYTNDDELRIKNNAGEIECIRVPYGATIVKFATKDSERHNVNYLRKADTTILRIDNNIEYPEVSGYETFIYSDTGKTVSYGMALVFVGNSENLAYVDYVYFE